MRKIYSLLLCCMICQFCYSQDNKPDYSISIWKDNKKAALSLTFDDAINGQFTAALPLLNKYNFKATFFLTIENIQWEFTNWNLIIQAAKEGHEIANHTTHHPYMHTISTDSMAYEFDECNKLIKQNISSQKVETMAYPYGDGGDLTDSEQAVRNVAYKYFIAARSVQYRDIFYNEFDFAKTNDDYYRVNSEMIQDSATVESFSRHLDSTIELGAWYVPTYHGIENGWIIVKTKDFDKNLQEINDRKDQLWIAPFVNVIKYIKERSCSKVSVLKDNAHISTLKITDTLSNKIWNEPLTINYKISSSVKKITEGKEQLSFIQNNNLLTFNAVPSSQKIKIYKHRSKDLNKQICVLFSIKLMFPSSMAPQIF